MEKEFYCSICLEEFSSELDYRHPIVLSCGHTFCRYCLQFLPSKKCPFDNQFFNLSKTPINYLLLQLLESRNQLLTCTKPKVSLPTKD